jgi:glycosyltransferase involved in cell wall biosynthesis
MERIGDGGPTALHVCTRYQRGGSERRVQDSIRALPHLRHHLLVGAESDVDLARRQTAAERVWLLPSLVRPLHPVHDARALGALWRLLRRSRYAVVVTHQSKAGVLTRTVAATTGGPPVVHSLSMASFGPGYHPLASELFMSIERKLGSRTAAFCVVGSDLAARFAAIGVPADRLHVVRSGVPLPAALPPRDEARSRVAARYGAPPGQPLLCYVGSLEPRKNPLLLARVLRHLHDRLPEPPHLLVLGVGPERARFVSELGRLGLADHAVLAGFVPDPGHVHDALRAADVTLLLSETEGLPQVLVQSAAVGTPFVAFDVEGVRELLDLGAEGTAVPLGDLGAAAQAVAGWLVAPGVSGREPVADLSSWSPESIAAGYRAAVDRALGISRVEPPTSGRPPRLIPRPLSAADRERIRAGRG